MNHTFATPFAIVDTKPTEPTKQVVVTGQARISIVADWDESRDGTAIYQAPSDMDIESAIVHPISATRASFQVSISNDRRQVIHTAHTRGSGKFYDRARGWYDGDVTITLVPK